MVTTVILDFMTDSSFITKDPFGDTSAESNK